MAQPALDEVLGQAYRYLSPRDRTVAEVRRHLTRRRVAPQLIDACLAELARQGYLDDRRFARAFSEDRRELDGWGSARIAARLRALGIGAEHVEAAIGGQDARRELEAAVELLRRRARLRPDDERARRRALGLLLRRGYELDLAHDALRRFEAEVA
jgi:regulatory protein